MKLMETDIQGTAVMDCMHGANNEAHDFSWMIEINSRMKRDMQEILPYRKGMQKWSGLNKKSGLMAM